MTLRLWAQLFLIMTLTACGGADFMDKTKIDGSVLRGEAVVEGDQIFGRTVYIAKNFTIDPLNPKKFSNFGLCSGVILLERYVLTSAHCMQNIEDTRVIFTQDVNKPLSMNQVYKIKDFSVPTAYTQSVHDQKRKNVPMGPTNSSHHYDIAVLQLDRPIENAIFSETYFTDDNSITYVTQDPERFNPEAYVAGYGRISEYNQIQEDPLYRHGSPPLTGTLMKAKLSLNITELSQKTITRSQRFSSGVCGGDSGAPLFTIRNKKLYLQGLAIATFKVKIEDTANVYNQCYGESIYLNLDYLKSWISETIRIFEKP